MPCNDQYEYLQEYIFHQFHILYNQSISLLPTQSNALCGIHTVLQIICYYYRNGHKADQDKPLKNLGASRRQRDWSIINQ